MIRSEQLVLAEWFMHLISIRIGLHVILKKRQDFFFLTTEVKEDYKDLWKNKRCEHFIYFLTYA